MSMWYFKQFLHQHINSNLLFELNYFKFGIMLLNNRSLNSSHFALMLLLVFWFNFFELISLIEHDTFLLCILLLVSILWEHALRLTKHFYSCAARVRWLRVAIQLEHTGEGLFADPLSGRNDDLWPEKQFAWRSNTVQPYCFWTPVGDIITLCGKIKRVWICFPSYFSSQKYWKKAWKKFR